MNRDKIIVRHDHNTHITLGILVRKNVQDVNDEYNNVQQYGVYYFLTMDIHNVYFSHPFNVILAMMKNDAKGNSSKRLSQTATSFRQLVRTVTSVEEETTKAGTSLCAHPAPRFAELTTKLNQSSVELSAMETAIRRYLANLLIMQTCSAKMDCSAHEELFDEITRFKSTLEDFSLNLRFIQNRITLQLNVVYSLVAQRDSRSNLDVAKNSASIARTSKRDSSAMKAIAVITAFFLPGTFIAVIHFAFVFTVSYNLLTMHGWRILSGPLFYAFLQLESESSDLAGFLHLLGFYWPLLSFLSLLFTLHGLGSRLFSMLMKMALVVIASLLQTYPRRKPPRDPWASPAQPRERRKTSVRE